MMAGRSRSRVRTYAISAALLLAMDLLWLGVISPPLYQRHLAGMLRSQPDALAAGLFYALYLIGVNEFVILAIPTDARPSSWAVRGALFGLVAYATFDLTAQATLVGWSPIVSAADMAWGTVLTAVVAWATALGSRPRGPR